MSAVSLFSGIGGLELGLEQHGFETGLFCEIDPAATAVLSARFPGVPLHDDVRTLKTLPPCEILTAGFPCQDLSLAGGKAGLQGRRSGLVGEIFRLLRNTRRKPRWLLIENVPYMLLLGGGAGMRALADSLEDEGYDWAYRVVDARSFGLPQRRQRVLLLASRKEDPRNVLFEDENDRRHVEDRPSRVTIGPAYGFYWTMGKMGAGWAREATPPIKGGSGLGIPSPPAIWLSAKDFFGTPQIEDAERLQGFDSGWTEPALNEPNTRPSARWRLIGNAVCPPMAKWVGSRLQNPGSHDRMKDVPLDGPRWPKAAWGVKGVRRGVRISEWPFASAAPSLASFLASPLKPLSVKATRGFRSRAMLSVEIAWSPEFIESLGVHITRTEYDERQRRAA
ncbi:DNA cytosine methyltransferase [Mesorhizobium dulcispinae]|uniref:DNA cytosine methyltransferase n=1 Tax=Mesorhizobium dulcispinae TaxID=3072316 RepID=UPI002A2453D7|nr:DNA cytosine methyltransferase [Mesorhizobium sp. VK23D]MDX8518722.1 DNA cytosine methyltransferase [Mesorhizobium sp. VK23D]